MAESFLNRLTAASYGGTAIEYPLSASASYDAGLNTTMAGGSYSILAALRSVGGTVTVRCQQMKSPIDFDGASATLTLTGKDQADPTPGTITIALPGCKFAGMRISAENQDFGSVEYSFTIAPGLGEAVSAIQPTIS